jgi:hypothetical protein
MILTTELGALPPKNKFDALSRFDPRAAQEGMRIDWVHREKFRQLLGLGPRLHSAFAAGQGAGDLGPGAETSGGRPGGPSTGPSGATKAAAARQPGGAAGALAPPLRERERRWGWGCRCGWTPTRRPVALIGARWCGTCTIDRAARRRTNGRPNLRLRGVRWATIVAASQRQRLKERPADAYAPGRDRGTGPIPFGCRRGGK